MNKKGSMELSVNSIVILVIAIVMLGLILGFVRSKFGDLDKQLVNNEPEAQAASPSDRLTVSRETIAASGGEEIVLKVQAYAVKSVSATPGDPTYAVPTVDCDGMTVTSSVQAKDVAQGEAGKYTMKLKIPSVPKGTYLCLLKMTFPADSTDTQDVKLEKDLVIEVK